MTELAVGRLTASTVAPPERRDDTETRLAHLLDQLTATHLERALAEVTVPPGQWCIRRLDVPTALHLDEPGAGAERAWSRAIVDALLAALAAGRDDVVHYRRSADALADLLIGLACGDIGREWAWRGAGLVTGHGPVGRGDVAGGGAAAATIVAAARRRPRDIVAALIVAIRRVGVRAVHETLGIQGWQALAELAATEVVGGEPPADVLRPQRRPASSPPDPGFAGEPATSLADAAESRSELAAAFGMSGFAATDELRRAWALLVVAEADPSILLRTAAATTVDRIAAESWPRPRRERTCRHESRVDTTISALSSRGPTMWGGLLFLLNTTVDADIPACLLNHPVLRHRPLGVLVHAIVRRMVPVADDDPAALAVAGLLPEPPEVVFTPAERFAIERCAAEWSAVAAARLDTDDEPGAACLRIALRRGVIHAEPGWLELHLDLDDVDLDVRRVGLDLDPGWVGWLGTAVTFHYA